MMIIIIRIIRWTFSQPDCECRNQSWLGWRQDYSSHIYTIRQISSLTVHLDNENPYLTDFSTGNKNSASLSSLGAFAGSNSTKEMSSETLLESCESGSRQVLQ